MLNTTWHYNTETGNWSEWGQLSLPRQLHHCGLAADENGEQMVVVAGGETAPRDPEGYSTMTEILSVKV